MKKFTGKSLLGEISLTRILRRIGLSLMVVFWAMASFAQEAQTTLEVKAQDYTACYSDESGFYYEAQVTFRDFIKIDTFTLVLEYDDDVLDFWGVTGVKSEISGMTVTESPAGKIWFKWGNGAAAPVTILPDNTVINVFKLRFRLDGYPHTYGAVNQYVFSSALHWNHDLSEYWNEFGQVTHILTDWTGDGSVTITQGWQDVVVTTGAADCAGGLAQATVTSPAAASGLTYSFNGSTFTSNATASVLAPTQNNTVRVKNGACISYYKKFDVAAPAALAFTAATPVYTNCPGGLGDIEILGFSGTGTPPYTFYVVPSANWAQVKTDLVIALTKDQQMAVLNAYKSTYNVIEKAPGTYWVAIQDANWCGNLRNTASEGGWWKSVQVIDNKTPWAVAVTETDATCFGQPDGRVQVTSIVGGTPFMGGKYNIWFNDSFKGKLATFDSDDILAPGSYSLIIRDSLACEWKATYTITEPTKVEFTVGHTDASCNADIGKIWINKDATLKGGTPPYGQWQITTDPSWATIYKTMTSVDDTAKMLPPGVYYARLFDNNDCVGEYKNVSGDNAIKVLDIDFNVVYEPIKCHGGTTTVNIVLVTGGGNHTFKYSKDHGATWQTSNSFTGIAAGTYWFGVKDETINCTVYWQKEIGQPTELMADIVEHATLPPTCPGNSDGKLVIKAWGGTPFVSTGGVHYYKYKMDNNPWVQASMYNTFAIDTAKHSILVEDANGCQTTLMFDWPNHDNKIAFQDTIWNKCALGEINLFNKYPEDCEYIGDDDDHWWDWYDGDNWVCDELKLDHGYLQNFEWYGKANEHFKGTIDFTYWIWTSDEGWVEHVIQGVQQQREPMLYIWEGAANPGAQAIVTYGEMIGHYSSFGAGTYWVVAMDEWGCFSNVEKIVIMDPPALDIEVTTQAAGCAGSFDGMIKIMAYNSTHNIPFPYSHGRYQYVLTQQPQIFQQEDWLSQVQWTDFTNGDFENDSLAVINLKKGTYWIAVRDWCSVENPDLIQFAGPIEVGGLDPVMVDWTIASTTNVTCNVKGQTPSNDGMITVPAAAVSGGSGAGSYTFKLEKVESSMTGTWPKTNTTGSFTGLWAGTYKLTVTSGTLGCQAVYTKTITQPRLMELMMDSTYVSCFGEHDGILRYKITGGTMPYYESTNNGANWYLIDSYTPVKDGNTTIGVLFDRRVREGVYNIWVKDSKECGILKDTINIKQPAKLNVALKSVKAVSCNDLSQAWPSGKISDGEIKVTPTGGWNKTDDFMYYVELWKGGTSPVATQTMNTLGEVTFSNLTAGDYVVKMYEWDPTNPKAKPYITYSDYFTTWSSLERPYQNPDKATCFATLNVTVAEPPLVTYQGIQWNDVKCYNTPTGSIRVYGVAGGSGKYQYMVQGPTDYPNNGVWYPSTATSTTEYTWSDLVWGHYTVHVKDEKGCWIYKESGEIQNQLPLTLSMQLIDNVICYKTATGKIKVNANGGVGGYTYAIDTVRTYTPGGGDFPLDNPNYLNGLTWQSSPEFMVKAGVWVGFVKDANGCVQGYAVDRMGQPVLNHRVTVLESTPVVATGLGSVAVKCHGGSDGKITFTSISGGNGGCYTARVWGVDYTGAPVDQMFYCATDQTVPSITGLKATWTEGDATPHPTYSVVFYDSEGCVSQEYKVAIMQPKPFIITVKDKQNAFICWNDKAGIFEIIVVQGGTPFNAPVPSGTDPIYKYKWQAWKDAGHTQPVDSLTGTWGFTKTFLGYAGFHYRVTAQDVNGCETYKDTFVVAPAPVVITNVKDITCYSETMGSAKVTATAEPGRALSVRYRMYVDENPISWKGDWSAWVPMTGGEKVLSQFFSFSDHDGKQGHFAFQVMDDKGCLSDLKYVTFNIVQNQLMITGAVTDQGECTSTVALTINGGIGPYTWMVDDVAKTTATVTLAAGVHTLKVVDAHECIATGSVTVVANPFVGNKEVNVEKLTGTDVKYPVSINQDGLVKDTTLAEGTHTITYMYQGCTRTMNVKVTATIPMWTIKTVQGEAASTSVPANKLGTVTGTVTGVVPGAGFYMQDASAAWSGIYVAYTTGGVLEGNGVKVTGTVAEVNGVTTLNATEVVLVTNPTAITPVEVAPTAAKAEMYESVLVKITEKSRASNFASNPWDATGSTGAVKVSKDLYSFTPVDTWYTIMGIIDGKASAFVLTPRKATDVVAVATGINPVSELEFKVYPNPFNDRIFIDNANKLSRVVISNIAGQRVIDVEYPGREIRTANLVSGVYVVSMFTDDGLAKTERIVKR